MIEGLKLDSPEINLIEENISGDFTEMLKETNFIQDFWIFGADGTRIYSFVRDPLIKKSIFELYFRALNGLVKDLGQGDLRSFKINDKIFTIFTKDSYLFVASSLTDNKVKKIKKFIQEFSNLIFSS